MFVTKGPKKILAVWPCPYCFLLCAFRLLDQRREELNSSNVTQPGRNFRDFYRSRSDELLRLMSQEVIS